MQFAKIFCDSTQVHDEGHIVNNQVFRLKPDPADVMGGITKDYFKSPPEAVSRFLHCVNERRFEFCNYLVP